jgi:hypothetical protein
MSTHGVRCAIADGALPALASLVRAARHRFLRAAQLLEWNSAQIEQLRALDRDRAINASALLHGYTVIAERYIEAFYSPQAALFPGAKGAEEQWWVYWHQTLTPALVDDDVAVRHILRAVGGLMWNGGEDPGTVLTLHLSTMTLPGTPPAWAPGELLHG